MVPLDIVSALSAPASQIIDELSSLPEDQWFERKSGRIAPRDLARPLIAFANAEGGTLVIGIHDGKIDPFTPENENEYRQAAMNFTSPPVRVKATRKEVTGGTLLILQVEPGESVHTTQTGDCFLRIGDESRKLSLAQQQELQYDRGTQVFEATPAPLDITDLDEDKVNAYRKLIGANDNLGTLQARDLLTRQGETTIAAQLLFDARPQQDFPNAYVRVITYNADDRGVGREMNLTDDVHVEGSIPEQITKATEEINKRIPTIQRLGESGRFERIPIIPRDAWLEGLVNAVVHRSYSLAGDHIRVEIYPRRIEITSPGRFPGLADPTSPLSIARFARNPRIARVCADMGITRELGEGIKRIFHEMQRLGLAEPIYKQTQGSVTLILSASNAVDPAVLGSLNKSARRVLDIMRVQGRPLSTGQVAELAGIARPTARRALDALMKAGLVIWDGKSDNDPRASWFLQ